MEAGESIAKNLEKLSTGPGLQDFQYKIQMSAAKAAERTFSPYLDTTVYGVVQKPSGEEGWEEAQLLDDHIHFGATESYKQFITLP